MSTDPQKPKIIVDDDWKTRVQAEREAAQSKEESPPPADDSTAKRDHPSEARPHLPPPSFSWLVSTLATEALAAMGHFPQNDKEPPRVFLDHAKHFIDTLGILEEKTKGNLTREEAAMLDSVLHQLRMAFVAARGKAGK